jgi:hypothetical protein
MKVVKGMVVAAVALSIAGVASASNLAAKFWYAEMEAFEDTAMNYGVSASVSMSETLWFSAAVLTGQYETPEGWFSDEIDTVDGEFVLGVTAAIVDVGVGARYSEWTFLSGGAEDELKAYGPMVYVGLGNTFGDASLGWYIGGSYMVKDFGDAYDDDDIKYSMEHYNVEGGLFVAAGSLACTVGYRHKEYLDSGDELIDGMNFSGPTGSVGFGF